MRTRSTGQSALLFLDAVEILQREKMDYAVIGAFALSVHGTVRGTMDVDAVVHASPRQMAALQEHGCDELQGFLLGRPGPLKGLTHAGFIEGQTHATRRGEARESLFASLPMDLPPTPPNR